MDLSQVQAGSYKGVPFLLTSGTVEGGNKNVIHSYPNSNRQTVENLGQTPRRFPLNIVIPSGTYVDSRQALLDALDDPTPGPLIHPLHGRLENMVAGPYALNESMSELGDGKITVTFFVDNGPGVPQRAGTTINTIARANNTMVTAVNANMASSYVVTPSFIGNFESATTMVQDAALAFKRSQVPVDNLSAFVNAVDTFASEAAALILAPANLANRITGIMDQASGLFEDPLNALTYYTDLFDFGDDAPVARGLTAGQQERNTATAIFTATMQCQALGQAYLSSAQGNYETVDEVEAVTARLDTQFFKVFGLSGLDDASKSAMADVRQEVAAFMNAVKLTAKRVVSVKTHRTSARLLAYAYYGDSSQGEAIANLNGIEDVNDVEGAVLVLTE